MTVAVARSTRDKVVQSRVGSSAIDTVQRLHMVSAETSSSQNSSNEMHHIEHLFSNFGCFSVANTVAAAIGEGCSVDAVLAAAGLAAPRMQNFKGSRSTNVVLAV